MHYFVVRVPFIPSRPTVCRGQLVCTETTGIKIDSIPFPLSFFNDGLSGKNREKQKKPGWFR
jgi:hypothetical protein